MNTLASLVEKLEQNMTVPGFPSMYEYLSRGMFYAWTKYQQKHPTLNVVFAGDRVYRLEIQSFMLVFSTPLVN